MNIGILHNDRWPLKDAGSIQSWQIFKNLSKRHKIFSLPNCPFPTHSQFVYKKLSPLNFLKKIDVLLIIVDGPLNLPLEIYTIIYKIFSPKSPVVWLLNAPAEEVRDIKWIGDSPFNKPLKKFLLLFVSHVICVSKNLENYVHQQLKFYKTTVIPNGSDPKLFKPQKSEKTFFGKNKFVIVWAGAAEFPWQNIKKLAELAKEFETIDPSIIFVLFAEKKWIKYSPRNNFIIFSKVSYFDLPKLLAKANMFICLYSNTSSFGFYNSPMKLFDFLSIGKPVLASNLGQINEIITKNNGLLTNNQTADLIKKINKLKDKPALRVKLGKQARKTIIDKYNWTNTTFQIEKVLFRLV